jgi:hypothetical protein
MIRAMLAKWAKGRLVLVVGERDESPERRGQVSSCPVDCRGCAHCWPGLFGMQKVSRELRCRGLMVPAEFKDVREMYKAGVLLEWVKEAT